MIQRLRAGLRLLGYKTRRPIKLKIKRLLAIAPHRIIQAPKISVLDRRVLVVTLRAYLETSTVTVQGIHPDDTLIPVHRLNPNAR